MIDLKEQGCNNTTAHVHWWKLGHSIGIKGGTSDVLVKACDATLCVNFPVAKDCI